jgi:hypothetical protein
MTTDVPMYKFLLPCLIHWDEHIFLQVEGRRFLTCSSSINLTFQVALLLGGYSMSASGDALFL